MQTFSILNVLETGYFRMINALYAGLIYIIKNIWTIDRLRRRKI